MIRTFAGVAAIAFALCADAAIVRGRVSACDGSVLPGVLVTLDGGATRVTDVDGRFVFEDAPSSSTNVTAELSGLLRAKETLCASAADRDVELLLSLDIADDCLPRAGYTLRKAGPIVGRVVTSREQPIRGAVVRLLRGDSVVAQQKTNRRGRFRWRSVPIGRYVVEVSAGGYLRKTVTAAVAPCSDACHGGFLLRLTPACDARGYTPAHEKRTSSDARPHPCGSSARCSQHH